VIAPHGHLLDPLGGFVCLLDLKMPDRSESPRKRKVEGHWELRANLIEEDKMRSTAIET